jgi:ATP-dependent helicase/nuclease subunit B
MSVERTAPRVFSIPSGVPFLATLADALLARRLVAFGDEPMDLAGVTVLLPTRRSVRAFRDTLWARLGGRSAILPTIRPIGEVDEAEQLLDPGIEVPSDWIALPPAISPLTRRLALTRLTLSWARQLRLHVLRPDEPLRVPGSAADAALLALDLARFMDDVETAGVGFDRIATLAPDDHAEYYRLTLSFLRIVSEHWPQYLAEKERSDPSARRDALTRAAAARIAGGMSGPVVAAGSTGSIPATAALLKAVAHATNGAVVLPGLDCTMDDDGWEAIGRPGAANAAYASPQFGMKQLIAAVGIERTDVAPLGASPPAIAIRTRVISEAMRPAETSDRWTGLVVPPDSLSGVDLVVAGNEQEEAVAIALAVREALATPGTTVAVVTPDRTLARRVGVELGRWGLAVDDSAGAPLDREPQGVFARLLVEAASPDVDPVVLLSLCKHPVAAFGMERTRCRRAARKLELALFRGRRTTGGIGGLAAALAASRAKVADGSRDVPSGRRRLSAHDWELAGTLVARLTECLGPVAAALARGGEISVAEATRLLADAAVGAASDDTSSDAVLWGGPGGTALAGLLTSLIEDSEAGDLAIAPSDFPSFLRAMMAGVPVQRPTGPDPRVHIWGALEARLQSVDLLVLAGLDEGVWPAEARSDPWLSRAMRAGIGLPPPERRIGLSAHDFVAGMSAPRVVATRAAKRDGTPTVESRWLQRLRAFVGTAEAGGMEARGARYVSLARALDDVPAASVKPVGRPKPAPPLDVRPRRLSITEIETLIRDPYAIYARHILKLEPLDPLGREPDAALRGTLIHKALGDFTEAWSGGFDASAEARLLAIGREVLADIAEYPDAWSVWSIRFAAIARWYVGWENGRQARVGERSAEVAGTLTVPVQDGVFTLRGRADRLDLMSDSTVEIYDFKTGTPQTDRTVFAGLTPQMTLEAAMARSGGFDDDLAKRGRQPLKGRDVADLAWLAVGRAGRDEVYAPAVLRGQTPNGLAERAEEMFRELVAAFDREDHPYLSRARPMMKNARYLGDYDHLARVREWALIESEPEVAG